MVHIFVGSVDAMFESDADKLAELIKQILRHEYDAFWGAAANAIVDLVERGYLK